MGFSLLTGRNDFAGRASHLEIRMFAVAADEQGKGIGKSMLPQSSKPRPDTGWKPPVSPATKNDETAGRKRVC